MYVGSRNFIFDCKIESEKSTTNCLAWLMNSFFLKLSLCSNFTKFLFQHLFFSGFCWNQKRRRSVGRIFVPTRIPGDLHSWWSYTTWAWGCSKSFQNWSYPNFSSYSCKYYLYKTQNTYIYWKLCSSFMKCFVYQHLYCFLVI